MDRCDYQWLLTDALLLDIAEGIDSIANRLVALYDRWAVDRGANEEVQLLGTVLSDLGWWPGRFEGAVSAATLDALGGLSGGS